MPTYNGHPRSAWDYTGSDQSAYNRWVNGNISTVQFQTITAFGNGTASLVEPETGEVQGTSQDEPFSNYESPNEYFDKIDYTAPDSNQSTGSSQQDSAETTTQPSDPASTDTPAPSPQQDSSGSATDGLPTGLLAIGGVVAVIVLMEVSN